ncbi:MAG TPA: Os1348 family NHLP clan protein [Candidatus Limnocylindria bacterium]
MSKEAIAKVIQRSVSDAAFRGQLATDPAGALRGYDLTDDEKAALRSPDARRLSGYGVDQRMSKAFVLGFGTAAVTAVTSSDLHGTVQSPDAAERNMPFLATESTSGVQSPDAIDRNAAFSADATSGTTAQEPRDIAPVDIGGTDSIVPSDAGHGLRGDLLEGGMIDEGATMGVETHDASGLVPPGGDSADTNIEP